MKPIPSLKEIQTNIANDLINKLGLSGDSLKTVLNAFDAVVAAEIKLLYLYLADIQDNIFPDTADTEVEGGTLERLGRMYLNRNPNPATVGVFDLAVTGAAGSVLRANLTFKSNAETLNPGQLYVLDAAYTCTGTNDIIEVRSMGAGSDYNLAVGNALTITEPVIGVNKTVVVDTVVNEPKAAEEEETYRAAILNAIQLEPKGGAPTDYRLWSSDAQGVRIVFPYVKQGNAGVVEIYVEATLEDSIDGMGTPSDTLLLEVEAVIEMDPDVTKPVEERGRRPIQAIIETLPITLVPVDVTISGLADSTVEVQDSIDTAITDFLYEVRPFIPGGDLARNQNDILYSGKMQSVVTDVLEGGNYFNNFVMAVDGTAVFSYQFTLGRIPYLRTLTLNP